MIRPHIRVLAEAEAGSSVLELALVTPLLLLLLAGAVDFGGAWRAAIAVSGAAEAGALYGVRHPADPQGMIAAARVPAGSGPLDATASYGCECAGGSSGVVSCSHAPACTGIVVGYVDVQTSSLYTPLMSLPGLASSFVLHGHARMRAAHGTHE